MDRQDSTDGPLRPEDCALVAALLEGKEFPLSAGFGDGPSVFGQLWPGHGLAQTRTLLFGERLTEPLVTRRLAHFLSPKTTPTPLAEARAHSFTTAILAAAGVVDEAPTMAPGTLTVDPELGCKAKDGGKRRADLWLEWRCPAGELRCLVVEAKIYAPDRTGQLRAYRHHLRNRVAAEPGAKGWCVYLTLDGCRPPLRDRAGWLTASWFGLLRHWETLLAADPIHRASAHPERSADPDFDSFRHTLWQNLTFLED